MMAAWVSVASPSTSNRDRGYGPQHDAVPGLEGRIETSRRTASIILGLSREGHRFDELAATQQMQRHAQQPSSPLKPQACDTLSPKKPVRTIDHVSITVDLSLHGQGDGEEAFHASSSSCEFPRVPAITTHPKTVRSHGLTSSPKKPMRTVDVDRLPRIPCRNHSKRDLRRVRFDDRASKASTFVYPGVDEELFPSLYYSKREISDIRISLKHRAKTIEASNRNVVPSILHLHGVMTDAESPAMNDREAARHLVQSGARGLENFLTPRIGKQRERAVQKILDVQDECHAYDDIEDLLRKWSETLSSSSCHYARNVAMIDAREALRASMLTTSVSSRSI
jgi:hypothetical protein